MSLREVYGLKDGAAVATFIRQNYLPKQSHASDEKWKRRQAMRLRLRLYRDAYEADIVALIDQIFTHPEVKKQRERLVEVVMGQNVTKRIVQEVASLYDQPARRSFDSESETERWRELEQELELHDVWQEAHHLTFLCNEVLMWLVDIDGEKSMRVVTPDAFDVVPHRKDPLRPVAVVLDVAPPALPDTFSRERVPFWEVWDDVEVTELNASGTWISTHSHGLGRVPGVLLHRKKPVDTILDGTSGKDIVSAHQAVIFLTLAAMQLGISQGEKQPYVRGNLSSIAADQPLDGQTPIALPPETEIGVIDLKTDPEHYLVMLRHHVASVAHTYGMSYEQFTFSETADTASGKAYEVRRQRLTELRREQRRRAQTHEPQVAELLGFDRAEMRTDFAEVATPADAAEEVDLLDKRMKKGLDSPIEFMMRKDPDLDRARAKERLLENLRDWAWLVTFARSLNVADDASATEPGQTPEQNGADNAQTDDSGQRVGPPRNAGGNGGDSRNADASAEG
jgi:hypothetical protein